MGLVIFAIAEWFIIMLMAGGTIWFCLRYKRIAAGWKTQADAFQSILNDYEQGRYQYVKLEKKTPDKKTAAKKKGAE